MAYLFSIRPEYCDKIFGGLKTVELRRRVSMKIRAGSLMLIYETSPTKAVTGCAVISSIQSLPINALWSVAEAEGGINSDAFDAYFSGLEGGFAIQLSSPKRFTAPIGLERLVVDYSLQAPQSYREIIESTAAALIANGQVSLGYEYPDPYRGCTGDPGLLCRAAA